MPYDPLDPTRSRARLSPLEAIARGERLGESPLERMVEGRLPPPRGTTPGGAGAAQPAPAPAPALTPEQELERRRSKIEGQLGGEPKDPARLMRQLEAIDRQLREIRFEREQARLRDEAKMAGQITPAQRQRLDLAQGIAGREIGEQSRLRQGQLESSLAGMGLGDSVVGERARAQERELSARMYQQTASQLLSGELQRSFAAEQAAIDRLFQSGQGEVAFQRQWQLAQRQINASVQIAEMQADSSLWGDIFGAIGEVAGAVIPGL